MSFEFWFFPLSGGKEIIHRFRNSFRNASTTTPSASATHISHMTLPRTSAASFSKFLLPRPQPHYVFQRFWLWLVSFPFILALGPSFAFILAFWAFISSCFILLGLHCLSFWPVSLLPWAWTLSVGIGREYCCLGICFFREASARLPQSTEAKRVSAEIGVFHL